jgi:hypothetical protein
MYKWAAVFCLLTIFSTVKSNANDSQLTVKSFLCSDGKIYSVVREKDPSGVSEEHGFMFRFNGFCKAGLVDDAILTGSNGPLALQSCQSENSQSTASCFNEFQSLGNVSKFGNGPAFVYARFKTNAN